MENTQAIKVYCKAHVKPIIKIILVLRGLFTFAGCVGSGLMAFFWMPDSIIAGFICIAACLLFFYIGKRYLENVYFKEYLLLTPDHLSIVYKTIFEEKSEEFDLKDVKYFGFAGQRQYTEHPMNNDFVDFTGLQTGERELQYLIDEGTIEIESEARVFRFGKNMASWEASDVLKKVEDYFHTKFVSKYPIDDEDIDFETEAT